MLAAVDALLPLSLLEAVREADTPDQEELDAELVDELRNKRLGLSETVYAQIKRNTDAIRRRQRVAPEETLALDRKSTRLNSSHVNISYAVFCLNINRSHFT